MRKQLSKALIHVKKVETVISTGVKSTLITRIDEEELFNLFTADIIKLKIKFTR